MRSSSSDGTVQLTPFTDLSLEQCIDFIEEMKLLEVTPRSLRLRKMHTLIQDMPGATRNYPRFSGTGGTKDEQPLSFPVPMKSSATAPVVDVKVLHPPGVKPGVMRLIHG